MKFQKWLDQFACGIITFLSFLICLSLGIISLFFMARMQVEKFEEFIPEPVKPTQRHFIPALAVAALLMLLLIGATLAAKKFVTWKSAKLFAGCCAASVFVFCLFWMNSYTNEPAGDQEIVWKIAKQLAGVSQIDDWIYEYLRMHPYQASIAMVMEVFIRLFGQSTFSWQIVSALGASACVLLCSSLAARVTNSPCAKALCAVLLLGFFPLAMYSNFIYGTLSGIALALLGIYAVFRECDAAKRKSKVLWWMCAVIAFTSAIILYKGEEIFLIAAALTLFAMGMTRRKEKVKMLAAIGIVAIALVLCNAWQGIAMHRMGMANDPGCPLLPRILMGVDAYSEVPVPGFCNGIHEKIFRECNYDAAEANRICVTHIRNSLVNLHKQGRFFAFFAEKTADQWLEPWYGGLTMSNPAIYNEPNAFAQSMIGGNAFAVVNGWLSTLMPVIYLSAAAGIFVIWKNKNIKLYCLLPMICLIGGFLFQLMAEAKARYCMPYYLCCFPMAAAGIAALAEKLAKKQNP